LSDAQLGGIGYWVFGIWHWYKEIGDCLNQKIEKSAKEKP
jgi:hypothetical protein